MDRDMTRRDFIGGVGRAAMGAAALAGAGPIPLAAAEGGAKGGPPRPVLAVRDSHLRETREKDCWAAMAAIGAEGVEARVDDAMALPDLYGTEKFSIADEAGIGKLSAALKAAGRKITALALFNRFDERPEFEVESCVRTALAAKALGTKAIRIDVWPVKLQGAEFRKFSVDILKKIAASTEGTGVAFGIENHGPMTNDPDFLKPLLEEIGSPRIGLTLDTGNFYWFGHPLSRLHKLFEELAPRVIHTHCKSIGYPEGEREKRRPMGWEYGKYCCPIDKGDVDFRRIVKILRAAGYANDLCVEDESLGRLPEKERGPTLAREIAFLKGLL
jgi:sugar phosphate isomerase/epimerase